MCVCVFDLQFSDLSSMMPSLMDKGMSSLFIWYAVTHVRACAHTLTHPHTLFLLDPSFSDDMSDLGSDADVSRGTCEPAVKRERIEINHTLQEI